MSWTGLTIDDDAWIGPSLVLLAALMVTGVALRWWHLSPHLTAAVQTAVGLGAISWRLTGTPLPLGGRAADLAAQVHHALELTRARPPAPVNGGVLPLLLAGTLIAVVLVDYLAVGLGRPAWAGAALIGIWIVPLWDGPVHLAWWAVAGPAAGFCLLLLLEQQILLTRWADRTSTGPIARGLGFGAAAVAVAVALPAVLPISGSHLLHHGSGVSGSHLTVSNPMVTLRRELVQGPDTKLLTVTTDDPAPAYLRIAALTMFRDNAWTPGERSVPVANSPSSSLPSFDGVDPTVARTSHQYVVQATSAFDSRWLPTQAPITALETGGDWRYDTSTMDFLAADQGLSTRSRTWQMTGVTLDLTSEQLLDTRVANEVSQKFLELPDDLPASVGALARSVTSGSSSLFAKAVALQRWFRTDGGFVYDTTTRLGDGTDDLVTFLTQSPEGRKGFCQQFAAAMAAMARSLHIPARVAVGFLAPEKTGDNTWVYSAHDLHAWPELYFQGAGWVRFEPTPSSRAAQTPSYTEHVQEDAPSPSASVAPTESSTAAPTNPTPRTADEETAVAPTPASSHTDLILVACAVLALAILLACPVAVRRWRRRRRLSRAGPEDLWAELRDTAVDLGAAWPETFSVRRQAALLHVGGEADGALARLVVAVERDRYADSDSSSPGSADAADLQVVRRSLIAAAGLHAKRRSLILPRSLIR